MSAAVNPPLLQLRSPLGDDTIAFEKDSLHAISLDASERISAPFGVDIEAISNVKITDPNELLLAPVSLTVRRINGIDRFFHGIVRQVGLLGTPQRDRWHYRLKLVPRLWFLEQVKDCRIFQQKTVVDILEVLFNEGGVSSFEFRVGPQPTREYTTQYNETNLRFVHRLLQEAGLFYYFEHSKTDHKMIIVDSNSAFESLADPLHHIVYMGDNVDIISQWDVSFETTYGSVSLWDYDPDHPSTPVVGHQETTLATPGAARRTVYAWPACTREDTVATHRARYFMEAAESRSVIRRGKGTNPNFCPGFCFVVGEDPLIDESNVEYVIRETRHLARDETWVASADAASWSSSFTCFPRKDQWREDDQIARPSMAGIYSGVVLGNAGEEIHADQLGRVKVRPLFADQQGDREKVVADKAIWIRVLHPWSGERWGFQHLPRVGTEVGLAFINGDPDNPVVVGCFYNAEAMPPFAIPSDQTRQGFRSHSTPLGGRNDYNELSFDDRKDKELVFLRARRDQLVEIGNNRSVVTEVDDRLISRSGNILMTAERGSITLGASDRITLSVGGSSIVLTPSSIDLSVGVMASAGSAAADTISDPGIDTDPEAEDAEADLFRVPTPIEGITSIRLTAPSISLTAAAAIAVTAGGAVSVEAGGDANTTAGGVVSIEAAGELNLEGMSIDIEALDGPVVCVPFPV
jgi:type VI secretion system secreted protein VgrG